MKRGVAAAVVVGVLGSAGPAAAQFFPGPGWGSGYYARTSTATRFGPGGAGFTASVQIYRGYRSPAFAPYGYYPPAPGWGGGIGWVPPPIVVAPPPAVVLNPADVFPPNPDVAALNAPDPPRVPADRNNFIAIRPGQPPPQFPVKLPPPRPVAPAGPPLDVAGERKADPAAEVARQVELARAAAAGEEYGRAAERLSAAVRAKPDEPRPYFLLAQVRFARGEYAEAVAAVRDGMKLAPDWPAAPFRPRELYGDHPARFDAHLAELRAAVAANPGDPTLGFLLGYQLWFTGQREEAARLFRRVTEQVKDNGIVERFLREVDAKVAGR